MKVNKNHRAKLLNMISMLQIQITNSKSKLTYIIKKLTTIDYEEWRPCCSWISRSLSFCLASLLPNKHLTWKEVLLLRLRLWLRERYFKRREEEDLVVMNPEMEFRRGNDDSVTAAVFVGNRIVVEAIIENWDRSMREKVCYILHESVAFVWMMEVVVFVLL